jgi:hypothetical protein
VVSVASSAAGSSHAHADHRLSGSNSAPDAYAISKTSEAAPSPDATSSSPSIDEHVDVIVSSASTRVVVTGDAADGAADWRPMVFLPPWIRLWQGMVPVPVGLTTRDAWCHVNRLSRALRVTARSFCTFTRAY